MESTHIESLVSSHLGLAQSLAGRVHRQLPFVEFDDLLAAGVEGLLQAARRYDPSHGHAFSTFAYYRVRGAIYDSIRRSAPSNHTDSYDEDNVADPWATRQDELLARAHEYERVREAVRRLPARRRRLIESHYFAGQTLKDAGAGLGISKSWASRFHSQTLGQLRLLLSAANMSSASEDADHAVGACQ